MSTLREIEQAISGLSPEDQAKLVQDLPELLPQWKGDLAWQRILREPGPSPALSSLVDRIDAEFQQDPKAFPEVTDEDFKRDS